jgi:hypothetical protein
LKVLCFMLCSEFDIGWQLSLSRVCELYKMHTVILNGKIINRFEFSCCMREDGILINCLFWLKSWFSLILQNTTNTINLNLCLSSLHIWKIVVLWVYCFEHYVSFSFSFSFLQFSYNCQVVYQ